MIEYIYIVKCPGCEDEMFNFFTDARMQCDLLMSKKPSITQVEVERNDFGECTDHHDLGTVWSWEEAMKDTEGGYTDAEPTKSIFTRDDLKLMADGQDPEFDNLDNSVDCEVEEPETSEVSPVERKPIPEGMTIEQLVEEMEENEDTVECAWCNDLFDKSECRYEVGAGGPDDGLGWLCSRCEMAIKSRGETLTFRENNYWDFLDEDLEELSFSEMVADSINHLINDLGKDSSAEDFADDVIADIENNYDTEVPEDPGKYRDWASAVACEVSRQLNNPDNLTEASLSDIATAANSEFGSSWNADDLLDFAGVEDRYDRQSSKPVVSKTPKSMWVLIKPNPPIEVPAELIDCVSASDSAWAYRILRSRHGDWYNKGWKILPFEDACKRLSKEDCERAKHMDEALSENAEPEELHDLGNEYDGGYPAETPEVSDSHLKLCPECGKETFDIETGICVDCGFN